MNYENEEKSNQLDYACYTVCNAGNECISSKQDNRNGCDRQCKFSL